MSSVFPKTESGSEDVDPEWYKFVVVADPPRLRRGRLHFVAVAELNRETWKHIRRETDDDFEWLPHPKQTDQLGLPLTDAQIDAWLRGMQQLEELMKGERLVPHWLLQYVSESSPPGRGLNFKTVLDDPPRDLFNADRIREKGIDPKYLEDEAEKPQLDIGGLVAVWQLYNGPLGFARAVRMN